MKALTALTLPAVLISCAVPTVAQERRPADRGERARAKILLFSDAVLTEERFVDADELRRRRRAMVEQGESFHHTLERVRETGEKKRRAAPPVVAPVDPPESGHGFTLIIAAAFVLLCAALRFVLPLRRREVNRARC